MPLKIAGDGGGPSVQCRVSRVRISSCVTWAGTAGMSTGVARGVEGGDREVELLGVVVADGQQHSTRKRNDPKRSFFTAYRSFSAIARFDH